MRGIAFRQRAVEVAEDVDRELRAEAALLHHRVDGRVAEEERELAAGRPRGRCAASRSPRAPSRAAGSARRRARRPAATVRGLAMPCSSKKRWARYLSPIVRHTSGGGASTSAGASSSRWRGQALLIEVAQGDDEADVVLGDERRERVNVASGRRRAGRAHAVGVVDRRREPVGVDGDRDVAPARPNALTMSTRCPAQVKRTTVIGARVAAVDGSAGPRARLQSTTAVRRPCVATVAQRQPPVAPLYVPPKSASGVRSRIVRSTSGERCSTYQTSSSMLLGPGERGAAVDLRPAGEARAARRADAAAARRTARPGSAASGAARSATCRRGRRSRAAAARRSTCAAGGDRRA